MRLIGMMACRNESYCLGLTLRAALQWCDEMVVLLHACTDDSARILSDVIRETGSDRVWTLLVTDEPWHEMKHRRWMLELARTRGATHLAIVDADELVTGNIITELRPNSTKPLIYHAVATMEKGQILQLPMYQLRGSLDRYHANGIWGNRWLSVAFQDDPRLSWSGDKFHSREPGGAVLKPYRPIAHGQGGSLHLWGVSERRLRAKHALYKVTERLRWPTKNIQEIEALYNLWRPPIAGSSECVPWTFADVPVEWWPEAYCNLLGYVQLDIKRELWQEVEVRRLVAEHGAETFAGLDLFGCEK